MKRNGFLKYRADAWPVVLVLASTALALAPFVLRLRPWVLVVAWLCVVYLRTFSAFIQHNHAHLPVFRFRALNRIFDVVLALHTGYVTAIWELHHNRGHHRHFLDPDRDVAALTYPGRRDVMPRWLYALRGNLTIHRDSVRIGLAEGRAGKETLLPKLALDLLLQVALTLGLAWGRPWLTLLFFVVPNLFVSWMVWWESYCHHLDLPGTDVFDSSWTVETPWYNLVTFNIGHHTAHHQKPTLHWSLLPERTAAIRHRIHRDCIKTGQLTASERLNPGARLWRSLAARHFHGERS